MANPIYPIALVAGAGLDWTLNAGDAASKIDAKRHKDWLDFNERKKQPGFNLDTDPYVIAGRNRHSKNPNMDQMQQAANAQPMLPNPNADSQRQQQMNRLKSNPELKAQFKSKYPYKYNELFNPTSARSNNPVANNNPTTNNTTTNAAQGAINNSQPSNQGSAVASNINNPVDMGHLPNKPNGNMWTGSSPYVSTASLLNPVQQHAQNSILPGVTKNLQNPINFKDLENETVRNYERNILPRITHRFTADTNGKLSSPAFGQSLREGGENLQLQLNAQRAKHELDQQQQQGNLLGTLMGRSQESFYNPGEKGLAKEFAKKAFGKVSEFALDQGLSYIKSLWSSNPAEAVSEGGKVIDALTPDKKEQLLEYVTTGKGKDQPQAVKDLIKKHATPSSVGSGGSASVFGETAGDAAKVVAGATAAGITGYYASKWLRPLIFDEGE